MQDESKNNIPWMESSSSGFEEAISRQNSVFSREWSELTLVQERRNCLIYTGIRYDRRFLIKALRPEHRTLTQYQLLQQKEFRLGVSLNHPHIAATYSLEEVGGLGECIVQEWVDGATLNDWLKANPARNVRERVLNQLLEALGYLHSRQLTHHDLKGDNILVTRNGNNVKLIDFGLSETDDSVSPTPNDIKQDIIRTGFLIKRLLPYHYTSVSRRCTQGKYTNISELQRALYCRKQFVRAVPVIISVCLLAAACVLFYAAYNARNAEQNEERQMLETVNTAFEKHHSDILQTIEEAELMSHEEFCTKFNLPLSFPDDALSQLVRRKQVISSIAQKGFSIRDSIMDLYPDDEMKQSQIFEIWTQKTAVLVNNLLQE